MVTVNRNESSLEKIRANGGRISGYLPFGYKNNMGHNFINNGSLDPKESLIAQYIFEKFSLFCFSAIEIGQLSFGQLKDKSVMARLTKNSFYCGFIENKNERIIHPYGAIISLEFFEQIQEKKIKFLRSRMSAKKEFIFSAFLRCSCGDFMQANERREDFVYRCLGSEDHKHSWSTIKTKDIDEKVTQLFKVMASDIDAIEDSIKDRYIDNYYWQLLGGFCYVVRESARLMEKQEKDQTKIRALCIFLFKKFEYDGKDLHYELISPFNLLLKYPDVCLLLPAFQFHDIKFDFTLHELNNIVALLNDDKPIDYRAHLTVSNNLMSLCTKPITLDELVAKSGKQLEVLQAELLDLQLMGELEQDNQGRWYKV